jgi:hypothetical protein
MSPDQPTKLKPYLEVRSGFYIARQMQLETQGPITQTMIRKLQQTRKYAQSPASAAKRG